MKTFITTITLILTAVTMCQAATVTPDTIKTVTAPHQVIVTRTGNTTTVTVKGVKDYPDYVYSYSTDVTTQSTDTIDDSNDWDPEHIFFPDRTNNEATGDNGIDDEFLFPFVKPKRATGLKYIFFRNLHWGWVFRYDATPGLKNSFETGIGQVAGMAYSPWRRGPEFSLGIGVRYSQFRAQDGFRYEKNGDQLVLVPLSPFERSDKSQLRVWTFSVPVMITQKIYRQLYISAGADINLNTYASAFSQYYTDGNTRLSINSKGLHQRLLTVDCVAIIGISRSIGAYARYSPMSLMQPQYGPEARSFSIGLTLNF